MQSPKILLIIPAFNEEKTIQYTLDTVKATKYDHIIINDGSTDNTESILRKSNANYIDVFSNLGIGGAVQTGYKYAHENNYDIAIQFDADGQHDISYIDSLVEPIIKGEANLVIGSCFVDKKAKNQRSSRIRRIGICFLSNFILIMSGGKRIYDPTSGFRAADRNIIERFAENYPVEYPEPVSNYELLRSKKYKIKEVPVKMNKRAGGKSSIRSWKSAYAAFNVMFSILILSLGRKKYD